MSGPRGTVPGTAWTHSSLACVGAVHGHSADAAFQRCAPANDRAPGVLHEYNEVMAHLPAYSPTAVLIGTGIFLALLVGILLAALLRRPPWRWPGRQPRRRRRPRR